ncbi:MAG: thioredoxin domain-containing protein [bacterium]
MDNRKPNWLINEKSLYLQQHAYNAVDWFPWCDEAFEKAKKEDKPIFLSIGYSSCHWCHVMAHESFDDNEIAKYLNENYIAIKVDKEERPDLDDIYMTVCQLLSTSCGWPLNIVMTPEHEPFWAGSYFSIKASQDEPAFIDILKELNKLWHKNPIRIFEIIDKISEQMTIIQNKSSTEEEINRNVLNKAFDLLKESFDNIHGGFEKAPKFPAPHKINFLLAKYNATAETEALDMAEKTLLSMYQGGIFDHIGGGFHRYSIDDKWHIPHFEKMIYDQALIANTYIEAYQLTKNELYADIAKKTLDFCLRELANENGGFYCGLDSDSEGKEGDFYIWTRDEIFNILGSDAQLFCKFYGITESGNFKNGKNVLYISQDISEFAEKNNLNPIELEEQFENSIKILYDERNKRILPIKDNKILTAWNGLMIKALSLAARVFNEDKYKIAATKTCLFILDTLTTSEGKLFRSHCEGESNIVGFLEDYAFFIYGLLELYEATYEVVYLKLSLNLADKMIEDFYDDENSGFFFTSKSAEPLFFNNKSSFDNSIPSANAIAVLVLQKLADITNNQNYQAIVEKTFKLFNHDINTYPDSHSQFLTALIYHLGRHRILLISENSKDKNTPKIIQSLNSKIFQDGFILYKQENDEEIESIYKEAKDKQPLEDKTEIFISEKNLSNLSIKGIDEVEAYLQE